MNYYKCWLLNHFQNLDIDIINYIFKLSVRKIIKNPNYNDLKVLNNYYCDKDIIYTGKKRIINKIYEIENTEIRILNSKIIEIVYYYGYSDVNCFKMDFNQSLINPNFLTISKLSDLNLLKNKFGYISYYTKDDDIYSIKLNHDISEIKKDGIYCLDGGVEFIYDIV